MDANQTSGNWKIYDFRTETFWEHIPPFSNESEGWDYLRKLAPDFNTRPDLTIREWAKKDETSITSYPEEST